jgi:hypothetical protein
MMLRQVLKEIETASEPISLNKLSNKLGVDPETLKLMLDYWVRQGKIEDNKQFFQNDGPACSSKGCGASCQGATACSFLASMPRAYTVVKPKNRQE